MCVCVSDNSTAKCRNCFNLGQHWTNANAASIHTVGLIHNHPVCRFCLPTLWTRSDLRSSTVFLITPVIKSDAPHPPLKSRPKSYTDEPCTDCLNMLVPNHTLPSPPTPSRVARLCQISLPNLATLAAARCLSLQSSRWPKDLSDFQWCGLLNILIYVPEYLTL